MGIIGVGFDITDQLLMKLFAFVRYWIRLGTQEGSTSAIRILILLSTIPKNTGTYLYLNADVIVDVCLTLTSGK
jgi:hypothetical protein